MDNPTKWNITNSAQNIVSALVDPSKQFDYVFRREWSNTFAGFVQPSPQKHVASKKHELELRQKLSEYVGNLNKRTQIKAYEALQAAKISENGSAHQQRQQEERLTVPDIFFKEDFDLSDFDTFNKVISSVKLSGQNDKSATDADIGDDVTDDDHELQTTPNSRMGNQQYQLYLQNKHHLEQQRQQFRINRSFKLLTTSQLKELQQSFTDFLDVIEERLASQISNRSGDFFQVMSSVDSVMDELSLAIKSVTSLRRKCTKLNVTLIAPNIKIIHLNKTRDNAQIVLDKMNEISYLYKVQPKLLGSDFANISELVESIANRFTEISERNSLTMSSLLQIQAEKFINKFHEERKRALEATLDLEQWKTVDEVPLDFQRLMTLLVDDEREISETLPKNYHELNRSSGKRKHIVLGAIPVNHNLNANHSRASSDVTASVTLDNNNDPPNNKSNATESISKVMTHLSLSPGSAKTFQRVSSAPDAVNPTKQLPPGGKVNYVVAGGSTYVIVDSVMSLVKTLMDYCKCAQDIRSLSSDLLERLFKILQLYNSKTYHLVYSAGAVEVAGLKNITTRSLVVSQRSLKLILLLLPSIHKHFIQLLPDSNRLRRFDEIKLSYEDHAAKIPERVNSIVRDVVNSQLIEWEAKPPAPSEQFTAIARHITKLHDNIEDVLPADELRSLFLRFSETFKEILVQHLIRLDISNDAGPQQWQVMQELTFYRLSLNKLSAFKGCEMNFDDIWYRLDEETQVFRSTATST